MRIAVLLAAVGATGCGGGVARVDPPDLSGARAAVVAFSQDNRVELVASAVDVGAPLLRAELRSRSGYAVYAVVYEQALEELELAAGPVDVVRDEPQRPLPVGLREAELTLDEDGLPADWQLGGARPSWLTALRIRGTASPCVRFDPRPVSLAPAPRPVADWAFAVPVGDTALTGTDQGDFFAVGGDGAARPLTAPPGALRPTAAALDAVGGIWVVDRFGGLWHGIADKAPSSWTQVNGFSPVAYVDFMDAAPDGTEVVVLARDGNVAAFGDGAWRFVHHIEVEADATARKGGVVALGRDDFLVAGPFSTTVAHVHGGMIDEEVVPAMSGLTALRRLANGDIVAGSGSGEVFVRRGQRWAALPSSGSTFWVLSLAAFRDGLVFGSPYGGFGQFAREDVACPLTTPVSFVIRFVVPVAGKVLLLGESLSSPGPLASLLVPR